MAEEENTGGEQLKKFPDFTRTGFWITLRM